MPGSVEANSYLLRVAICRVTSFYSVRLDDTDLMLAKIDARVTLRKLSGSCLMVVVIAARIIRLDWRGERGSQMAPPRHLMEGVVCALAGGRPQPSGRGQLPLRVHSPREDV